MTDNAIVPVADRIDEMKTALGIPDDVSPSDIAAMALGRMAAKSGTVNNKFLTCDPKSGIMRYKEGTKTRQLDADDELAVNIFGISTRWTCWIDGKPAESFDLALTDEDPDEQELEQRAIEKYGYDPEACAADEDCSDGWNHSLVIPMRSLLTGEQFEYLSGNRTMINSASKLIDALSVDARLYDVQKETPIVAFSIGNYVPRGKKFMIYYPIFTITDWLDNEELDERILQARKSASTHSKGKSKK